MSSPVTTKITLSSHSPFHKERLLDLLSLTIILAQVISLSSFLTSLHLQRTVLSKHVMSSIQHLGWVVSGSQTPPIACLTPIRMNLKAATNRMGEMEQPTAIPTYSCCQSVVTLLRAKHMCMSWKYMVGRVSMLSGK